MPVQGPVRAQGQEQEPLLGPEQEQEGLVAWTWGVEQEGKKSLEGAAVEGRASLTSWEVVVVQGEVV